MNKTKKVKLAYFKKIINRSSYTQHISLCLYIFLFIQKLNNKENNKIEEKKKKEFLITEHS